MADPSKKPFRLRADQIRPVATGHGSCIASDLITCGGYKVAFMYRQAADNKWDSGWRFFSGFESDEHTNNPDNYGLYDVNTIANYDPEIITFIDAPVGAVFERENGTGPFIEVDNFNPPND